MKQNRIGLLRVALEATSEQQEASDTTVIEREGAATEDEPAKGNQDEVPAAGTESAREVQPDSTDEAASEGADDDVEAEIDEADLEEEGPLDPDAPPLEEVGEVDMIDLIQEIGDLRNDDQVMNDNAVELKKAAGAVTELEDLANSAEETKAIEADTDAGRAVLELAVESIYSRLGIENPSIALEDAAGMGATVKDKVNNIREQVVRLLRTILEAIKRAYNHVLDFIDKICSVANRVEKACITVREKVRRISSKETIEGSISNDRIKNAVSANKSVTMVECFDNLHDMVKSAVDTSSSSYMTKISEMISDFIDGKASADALMDKFPRVLKMSLDKYFPYNAEGSGMNIEGGGNGDVSLLHSEEMPGAHYGVLCLPKLTSNLKDFEYVIKQAEGIELKDLPILNKEELLWMTEKIIRITSSIRQYKGKNTEAKLMISKFQAAIDKIQPKHDFDFIEEDKDFLRSLATAAPAFVKGLNNTTFEYAVRTCAKAVQYAELCAAKYEKSDSAVFDKNGEKSGETKAIGVNAAFESLHMALENIDLTGATSGLDSSFAVAMESGEVMEAPNRAVTTTGAASGVMAKVREMIKAIMVKIKSFVAWLVKKFSEGKAAYDELRRNAFEMVGQWVSQGRINYMSESLALMQATEQTLHYLVPALKQLSVARVVVGTSKVEQSSSPLSSSAQAQFDSAMKALSSLQSKFSNRQAGFLNVEVSIDDGESSTAIKASDCLAKSDVNVKRAPVEEFARSKVNGKVKFTRDMANDIKEICDIYAEYSSRSSDKSLPALADHLTEQLKRINASIATVEKAGDALRANKDYYNQDAVQSGIHGLRGAATGLNNDFKTVTAISGALMAESSRMLANLRQVAYLDHLNNR